MRVTVYFAQSPIFLGFWAWYTRFPTRDTMSITRHSHLWQLGDAMRKKKGWSALGKHSNGRWYTRRGNTFKYFGLISKISEEEATTAYNAFIASENIKDTSADDNARLQTVNGLFDYYWANANKKCCDKSWKDKRRYCDKFAAKFGTMKPIDVKGFAVEKWIAEQDTLNDTGKCNCLKHISSVFNWLYKHDICSVNPIKKMDDRPKPLTRGKEILIEEDEYIRLLEHIDPFYKDVLVFAWEVGCRPSEALKATVDMYDKEFRELDFKRDHKTGTSGKERVIFLTDEADKIVRQRIEIVKTGLLFPSMNNRRMDSNVFRNAVQRAAHKAGLPDTIIGYSFRHSLGYRKLKAGHSIEYVATLLGNSPAVVAKHYAHLLEVLRKQREEERITKKQ